MSLPQVPPPRPVVEKSMKLLPSCLLAAMLALTACATAPGTVPTATT
ncbi:DUF3574 domain-containing protein, partial [Xanthomonas perforans]|nr:DUF3574 domain-containing protein [Xanthomonas perforans]